MNSDKKVVYHVNCKRRLTRLFPENIRNPRPTPVEFKKITDSMEGKELTKCETEYFEYPQTKYLPLIKPDISVLKATEIEVIEDVLKKLSDMSANEISEYSHKDVPWMTTEDGERIDYESVFYRTMPYSVRTYDEEDV